MYQRNVTKGTEESGYLTCYWMKTCFLRVERFATGRGLVSTNAIGIGSGLGGTLMYPAKPAGKDMGTLQM